MSHLGSGVSLSFFFQFQLLFISIFILFLNVVLDAQQIFYASLILGSSWTLHVLNHAYVRKKGHKILLLISALTI